MTDHLNYHPWRRDEAAEALAAARLVDPEAWIEDAGMPHRVAIVTTALVGEIYAAARVPFPPLGPKVGWG